MEISTTPIHVRRMPENPVVSPNGAVRIGHEIRGDDRLVRLFDRLSVAVHPDSVPEDPQNLTSAVPQVLFIPGAEFTRAEYARQNQGIAITPNQMLVYLRFPGQTAQGDTKMYEGLRVVDWSDGIGFYSKLMGKKEFNQQGSSPQAFFDFFTELNGGPLTDQGQTIKPVLAGGVEVLRNNSMIRYIPAKPEGGSVKMGWLAENYVTDQFAPDYQPWDSDVVVSADKRAAENEGEKPAPAAEAISTHPADNPLTAEDAELPNKLSPEEMAEAA